LILSGLMNGRYQRKCWESINAETNQIVDMKENGERNVSSNGQIAIEDTTSLCRWKLRKYLLSYKLR
jgi:hypothetical protein